MKERILEFKAAADVLASYGMGDRESMDAFLKELSDRAGELDSLKAGSNLICSEITELFRLKRNIGRFQKAAFVYGPLRPGGAGHLKQAIDAIRKDCSRYDWLSIMKSRLDKLPDISKKDLDSMEIPHPEEYRFFHDLLAFYPEMGKASASDPARIHGLLARLKSDGFFSNEMKRELEREKAGLADGGGENARRSLPSRAISGRT